MPLQQLPILKTQEVFHIGLMQLEQKASRFNDSYEGHCLSVSHCPEAWRSIAKLGGFPLWSLRNPEAVFLDVHAIASDEELRKQIIAWGFEQKLVELKTLFRVWNTDESDDWRYSLSMTQEDAEAEAESNGLDAGPDDGPVVEPTETLVGTDLLSERVNVKRLGEQDSFDFLVMIWAEETQPAIDGVWWRETYDPESLSAPRGGVFPSRLDRWKSAQTSFNMVDDDETEENLMSGFLPVEPITPPRSTMRM